MIVYGRLNERNHEFNESITEIKHSSRENYSKHKYFTRKTNLVKYKFKNRNIATIATIKPTNHIRTDVSTKYIIQINIPSKRFDEKLF